MTEEQRAKHSHPCAKDCGCKRHAPHNHKVVSVEFVGREDVYDLSVEKYHNFAANGVFIHNCFKFDVQDNMDAIMDVSRKAALVQKWGGGVGYALSEIRPKGAAINSTHRKACGPVAALRHYHSTGALVTQAGRRASAQMGILHCEHPDVLEFINSKNADPQSLSTFNISVALTDEFMQGVEQGHDRELTIWKALVESAWKTGDPGVFFIDAAERDNPTPHLGKLTGTNPCGEVPLLDNEACNLGSINVGNFISESGSDLDWTRLSGVIRLAVHYLDEVIDQNDFPVPEITAAVQRTRKLGLGIMGWADALALLKIHYDTEKALTLADQLAGFINGIAAEESGFIGAKLGVYPGAVEGVMYRNATRTCIAPTGSISLLAGCSSGIEPHYARTWSREMGDGTILEERIPVTDRLEGFVPKTAMEIDPRCHIRMQAAFQKYTDLAVSKTINLPNAARIEDIENAYLLMWKLGCKGGTIYRDGCRNEQVLRTPEAASVRASAVREKLPRDRNSITHKMQVGDFEGYLTVGLYEDGRPGEIFIKAYREGSTVGGLLDTIGVLSSFLLQHGVPVERLAEKLVGARFEPAGMTGNPDVPNAKSIVDYVFRWITNRFSGGYSNNGHSGNTCPDCLGHNVRFEEGCEKCVDCGWSRC